MSDNNKSKNIILIIIFAVVFSFVVQDGIRVVIKKFMEIPDDRIGLAQWGDTFFLRIFASLIGTAAGTFILGTYLKSKARLVAIIATIPTFLFWVTFLIFGITIIKDQGYSLEGVKAMLLIPGILAFSSPVVGYFSSGLGQQYFDAFQRPKSILNIKWYHWIWILPSYLNKVVALPLFSLILLWKIDFLYDTSGGYPSIFDFISNWGYYIARIILLFIIIGLVASVIHVYSLLSDENKKEKSNWKNGLIIFSYVLLFTILYVLLFAR